jgi:integrase
MPRSLHDLRQTAVALWIAAGAGPKEVATRAGHTSVSFTLDRGMRSGWSNAYDEFTRSAKVTVVVPY